MLLDTHVWLWMHGEPARLGPLAARRLRDPSTQLFVSAVSAWELSIKSGPGNQ